MIERRSIGGSVSFAREERETSRWGGLAVEDGDDGIRVWECSSLKNEGQSIRRVEEGQVRTRLTSLSLSSSAGIEDLFAYVNHQLIARGERLQKEKERRDRESVNLTDDIPTPTKTASSKSAAACCSV